VGAAGVNAVGGHLEHPDRPTAHAVTTPAEDDGVDSPGKNPLQQYLSLFLMKQPAKDEMHQAGRL
jgi:hypothetical protein